VRVSRALGAADTVDHVPGSAASSLWPVSRADPFHAIWLHSPPSSNEQRIPEIGSSIQAQLRSRRAAAAALAGLASHPFLCQRADRGLARFLGVEREGLPRLLT